MASVRDGGDGDGDGAEERRSGGEVRQRGWACDLTELGLATSETRTRHHLISPATEASFRGRRVPCRRISESTLSLNSVVVIVNRKVVACLQLGRT